MWSLSDTRDWLREHLATLAVRHDVPGVQVAVLTEDQVVEETAGVLNLRTGVEVTPDSVFQIGSITKVFTATLVMQLVDEGAVDLDAPVRSYLPMFRLADQEASGQITIRHLLTHTAGFFGDLDIETTHGDDAIQRLVEDVVPSMPQMFPPGQCFSYTNAGYDVLGRLVEVLRGMPYAKVLRRWLLDPLGSKDSATGIEEAILLRAAVGHLPGRDGLRPTTRWAMCESGAACGSLLSMSARGLVEFARMHMRAGVARDGSRLLSQASAQAMRQAEVDHPPLTAYPKRQSLGWMLLDHPDHPTFRLIEHGGDGMGQGGLLQMLPDHDLAVAVLSNGGDVGPVERQIFAHVLRELASIEPFPEFTPPTHPRTVDNPARYIGAYRTPLRHLDIETDSDQRLWWTMTMASELPGWVPEQQHHEYRTVEPGRRELVRIKDDIFCRITPSGDPAGIVAFTGHDSHGRATLQYDWEGATPRAD